MPPDDNDSPAELRERLEQLEQTVATQQQTLARMLPGRRDVLKGLGGAAAGGVGVYAMTGGAAGQASGPAGLQGTEDNPNDMWAWDLDVQGEVTSDLAMAGNDLTDVGAMDVDNLAHAIENSSNVSGSRSIDTWETNTTGNVLLSVPVLEVDPDSGTEIVRIQGEMNNDAQSSNAQTQSVGTGTGTQFGWGSVTMLVPDGAHYRVRAFGDTDNITIDSWREGGYTE